MVDNDGMNIDPGQEATEGWQEVTRGTSAKKKNPETPISTMQRIKITLTIHVPKDRSDFTPAKIHIDTLHEMHKFDDTLKVLDSTGELTVNIEKLITASKYKEIFRPQEKSYASGAGIISIAHYIYLSTKASDCKETIFPFLKKNKVFLYFNQKSGLEHFSAVGILFGPNPDYIWRDELTELLTDTMKGEVTDEERKYLDRNSGGHPKLLLSLNVQTIGSSKDNETSSVALEIRVPSGLERTYTNILDRMFEKAEAGEIVIPKTIGKFFPYYLRYKKPEIFDFLMRQQNAEMKNTAIIPIFGYTSEVQNYQINIGTETTTIALAIATNKNIVRIQPTPSSWNLHKYLVITTPSMKQEVQRFVHGLFSQVENTLENQPKDFPLPRCGGKERTHDRAERASAISSYIAGLEAMAIAQNPQEAGPTSPPKRHRKITISYASAAQAGIINDFNPQPTNETPLVSSNTTPTTTTTKSQVTKNSDKTVNAETTWGSSLTQSIANSKLTNLRQQLETSIQDIRNTFERRMEQQERQIQEMKTNIKTGFEQVEDRIAMAVVIALKKEKDQVMEITHGSIQGIDQAPLADNDGKLPYGPIAQAGGPLDRLHHVEVTMLHLVNVVDHIAKHMQIDVSPQQLFEESSQDEDDSIGYQADTDNMIEDLIAEPECSMTMLIDPNSGKRTRGPPDKPATPSRQIRKPAAAASPPKKREKAENQETSADPTIADRERGEN